MESGSVNSHQTVLYPCFLVFKKNVFQKCIFQKCISRSVFFNVVSSSVFGQVESGNELSIKLPDSIIPPLFRLQVFAELELTVTCEKFAGICVWLAMISIPPSEDLL